VLNVKKKKNLNKIATILGIWLGGELIHYRLSTNLVVVKNYGISFGISGRFFIFLNIIFVVLLTIIWWKNNLLGISLVMVGGWINLFDRIIFGYVRDYWQLGWVYNNLADWIIQVGVIMFLSKLWIKKLK
jgi:lipoprotein signal peptidase